MTTAKKATTTKAPAKKPAAKKTTAAAAKPRARAVPAAAPVEEEPEQQPGTITKPIDVAGRSILFKCPTLEQLMDLEETFTNVNDAQKRGADYPEAKALTNEYYQSIYYLMADPEDEVWMRDARKRGTVTLYDESFVTLPLTIVELFKPEIEAMTQSRMNREQRRAQARKRA